MALACLAAGLLVGAKLAPGLGRSLGSFVAPIGVWIDGAAAAAGRNPYWILALLPGLIALGYWGLSARGTFDMRSRSVADYVFFRREYDRYHGGQSVLLSTADMTDPAEIERRRPKLREFLFGAAALTMPFVIVAALSSRVSLGMSPEAALPALDAGIADAGQIADGGAPDAGAVLPASPAAPAARGAPRIEGPSAHHGVIGLVLAGYGAYFYLLLLLIYRVNATALSPRFLVNSSLRATTSLVLGFLAGLTGVFEGFGSGTQRWLLYALLGAFPTWAAAVLQRKARDAFKRPVPGTEPLPLDLVDGIDELIAERLAELGISDIQHLSTSDPGDLSLRTLYPLERVIDWIDQAVLITYLKEHIVEARAVGIRGAIDMAGTYREAKKEPAPPAPPAPPAVPAPPAPPAPPASPAPPAPPATEDGEKHGAAAPDDMDEGKVCRVILADLATKSGLPLHVIYNIGMSVAYDYQIRFLSDLWQRRGAPRGVGDAAAKAVDAALQTKSGDAKTLGEQLLEAKQLDEALEAALRGALATNLGGISLRWEGRPDDLTGAVTVGELKSALLRCIVYAERKGAA